MSGIIGVDSPLLGLAAAIEAAGSGVMGGAAAGAAPTVAAVLPPGGDVASAAAAAGLSARGAAALAMMTELATVRSLFASTIGVNGVSYAAQDAINQATLAL